MKNTLVALAALTAAAGACAQSSVTVFGVLDTSIAHISARGSNTTGLSSGGLASSRIGFRGVEDLGGGLAAGFWLEGSVGADTGTTTLFDRRSTVSLSGAYGEVRIGRDKVPTYLNIETFDAFGDAGVGGIGASNLVGSATSAAGTPEGSAPKRASNSVSYLLPANLGGFYGQVQYAFGEQVSGVANESLRDALGARIGYAAGPLDVALAQGEVRGGTTAAGIDYKATNVGASYNFGVIKPMLSYATERGNGRKVEMFEVSATAPVGVGVIRAAYSIFKRKDINDADSSKLALGYVHNLSKRTALYGTIARVNNDRAANRGLAVSSSSLASPTIGAGSNVSGYELGLRHTF
ncbi:MAG: porin [Pseudomonadota bacterium]